MLSKMQIILLMNVLCIVIVERVAQSNMPSLSVPTGIEGSQLTLTCQFSEGTLGTTWISRSNSNAMEYAVGVIYNSLNNKSCVPLDPEFEPSVTLYSYSCPSSSRHTLTIKNVTLSNRGEIWKCGPFIASVRINSNTVTISVQVQVTGISLSPSTDVTTVNTSQQTTFECTVPRSLPSANIVWYKNSSGVISELTLFTSVSSTTNSDGTVRTTGKLKFSPNKLDNGVGLYCTASNGGTSATSRQITLNVHYESTIDRFGILGNMGVSDITVDENVPSTIACFVDSNPGATISLLKAGVRINRTENSRRLESTLRNYCNDSGVYTCSSVNDHNIDGASIRNININVQCAPRKYPNRDTLNNVTIAKNTNVTLVFYSLANPAPQYSWQKCVATCINITDGIKYKIVFDGMVSSLTVINVQQCDYGSYRVVVSNAIGTAWIENYNVLHQERPSVPSVPSYFHYSQHLQSPNTISFYWLPGYNGGCSQTYIIEYKKLDSQVWNQTYVVDDSSKPLVHVTVENLSLGSEYQARAIAKNEFGASGTTDTVTFTTQSCITSATHHQVGLIVGGVVPGVLLVGFVAILIYLRLTNRIRFKEKGKENNTTVYEDVSERNEATNRVYEGLSSASTSTRVYTSLQDSTDNSFGQSRELDTNEIELQS